MRTELSDLLYEAAQDGPPPRYDVVDAVRAGKRRQRHHRAGWTVGAALAVAAVVVAPQVLARPPGPMPVTPKPSPSVTVVAKAPPIDFIFRGYTTGKLTVSDPYRWTLAGFTADIEKKGGDAIAPEGMLTVYHPGFSPYAADQSVKRGESTSIGGRPGFFATDDGYPMLVWQYTDRAYATVTPRADGPGRHALSNAELRQVAEAFHPGTPRPVTSVVRLSAVPVGFTLVEVGQGNGESQLTSLRLLPTRYAIPRNADTDHGALPDPSAGIGDQLRISVLVPPAGLYDGDASFGNQCTDFADQGTATALGGRCYRWLPDRQHVLMATGRIFNADQLIRLLDGAEFADPAKPGTWFPANQAVPSSAQVGGE